MQMDELTQQNAALVEEATAASQAMSEQARALDEMMSRYDVDTAAHNSDRDPERAQNAYAAPTRRSA